MEMGNSSTDLQQVPPESHQWPSYSRRLPIGTPLKNILQAPLGFDGFSDGQKTKLRKHIAATVPVMPCAELDQFLCDLFAQDDVLTAYFRPTELYIPQTTGARLKTVLPFDAALAAATRAGAMPALFPHERRLASLASLVYPCAVFHAADPALRSMTRSGPKGREQDLALLRQVLIEEPLRSLRRTNTVMAHTLAAALGANPADECEPHQLARLVSSVKLATVGIDQLWGGQPRKSQ